jgi:glycosyltransferase involved in cell wall biosynthesis
VTRARPHPLRIAYIINSVEGGGAALPVPALATLLKTTGAEITVFALTRRDGRALAAMEQAGLEVRIRPGGRHDHANALGWLLRELRAWRPTHLWTSLTRATLLGQVAGRLLRRPVASWQHAAWLKPANLRLLRATWRWSGLWVADSEAVAGYCRSRIGVSGDRLTIWPIFRADPDAPPARPWIPGQPLRIATLGRLHPVKGYDVLIAALARLQAFGHQVHVTIGGEGAEREALTAAAATAGVSNVELAGYIDEPRQWLAQQHLYVQPSRSEGFCVSAHEAMQAGLPVIGSAVGEMAHSIEDGITGWRLPPGDASALAETLQRAISAPERWAGMGAAARARLLDRFGPAAFDAAGLAFVERLRALD